MNIILEAFKVKSSTSSRQIKVKQTTDWPVARFCALDRSAGQKL